MNIFEAVKQSVTTWQATGKQEWNGGLSISP